MKKLSWLLSAGLMLAIVGGIGVAQYKKSTDGKSVQKY